MKQIKVVFWDIDGVKLHSEWLHQEKNIVTARDPHRTGQYFEKNQYDKVYGVYIDSDKDWPSFHGKGDHYIYEWIIGKNPKFPLSVEQFLKIGVEYYLENAYRLKRRSSAFETFEYFEQKGLVQVPVSSGVRIQVDKNLEIAGVYERVPFSISSDDVVKTKPHPEPYIRAFEKIKLMLTDLKIQPEECLVIEDSPSGVNSGKSAGMTTVYWKVKPEQQNISDADYTLSPEDSLLELAKTISESPYRFIS